MERNKWGIGESLFPLILVLFISCSNTNDWVHTLPKPWKLSEEQVSKILPQLHQRYPDFHDRLKAFALWQVGKPYELFCLGEEEGRDTDPIIRLDKSDCTVHILTTLSFAQAKSWEMAKKNMIAIHYKDGNPSYQTRWHYTLDRLQENVFTKDLTLSLYSEKILHNLDVTLNLKEDGTPFLDLEWKKRTTVYYLPSKYITQSNLNKIPNVCGVAFVKRAYLKKGLVIAHEGMIIDQKNIIHASSEYGKTVNVDFMDYYFDEGISRFDGIMIFGFNPFSD